MGTLEPGQTNAMNSRDLPEAGQTHRPAIARFAGLKEEASADVFVGEAKLAIIKTGPRTRAVKRPTPYLITAPHRHGSGHERQTDR